MHMQLSAAAALALLVGTRINFTLKCITFITGIIVWSGLFWSGGRGPLAGLAAAVVIWFWFGGGGERRRLAVWGPALVLTGILGSYFLGSQAHYLGWKRVVSSTVNTSSLQGFSSDRNLIWGQALREINRSPWFGQGADSYRFIQPLPVGDQPHNFILQWVLAFGAPAALALVVLLGRRTLRGLISTAPPEHSALRRAAASALVAATVGGLFDGVFYHAVAFIPVAILAGLAGSNSSIAKASPKPTALVWRRAAIAMCVAAAGVIALRAWLFFNLLAPPPSSPHTAAARVLHAFPSAIYGFWRWIEAWSTSVPVHERLAWLKWAQRHAPQPAIFYYKEAQCSIERRDLTAAKNALERAVATSTGNDRRHYAELLRLTNGVISSNGK
jgi:O-antigen ligase